MTTIYDELEGALVAAGLPARSMKRVKGCELEIEGPVAAIVNLGIDASPYAEILLDFARKLTAPNEIDMVVRCMRQPKAFQPAVPWMLSLFEAFPNNGLTESHLWAVGDVVYAINAKQFYPNVVLICRNPRFSRSRQMLMGVLARTRTDEAYRALIECLGDSTVRAHAIEALGRFGRVSAIELLEPLDVQKGMYEFKAKATAIRRLRRLQLNNAPVG